MSSSLNLLDCHFQKLEHFFVERQQTKYRAKQVFCRLHQQEKNNISDCLVDLPQSLRQQLIAETTIKEPDLFSNQQASDGVVKLLFSVGQGQLIESVIIPEQRRTTLCISSQVGCALACRFCLTGQQGFSRNLTTAEIIAQLRVANRLFPHKMSNVVMMGMGEPLLNLEAVLPALSLMTDKQAYALSPRRVTVSTAGIVPAIFRLRESITVSLAVSLHAAVDSLRDEIMPINRKYPLDSLMEACHYYIQDRPRASITFEYVMLAGINDSVACAQDLITRLQGIRCKINLIPFNIFPGADYQSSSWETISDFRDRLIRKGIMTTIRKTRGDDILAACGQLAGDVCARKNVGLSRRIPVVTVS